MKITLSELKQIIREEIIQSVKHEKNEEKPENESEKKHDVDGDGDEDAADYKAKTYMAGGMSKKDAIKKSRKFDGK